jgi:DNA-binding CsgD family transcriptional regulator
LAGRAWITCSVQTLRTKRVERECSLYRVQDSTPQKAPAMNELARVMDTVALPVFALDADAYYVYENEQAQDFLGYDPMAITEKHITDLIVYDPALLIAAFDSLKRRGYFSGSVLYRHRNSSLVEANVNTFRQTLGDGTTVFVALAHPLAAVRRRLPEVVQATATHGLTGEEMRLLQLLADGFSDEQISQLLGDHERLIREQIRLLLEKMNASSRTQAVVLALKKRVLL